MFTYDNHGLALAGLVFLEAAVYAVLFPVLRLDVTDSAVNIRNKVARGGFSAAFFLQCLRAIVCHALHLEDA